MKWLILLVTFCIIGQLEKKPSIRGYMKCIPFSTKTAVDLHEESMLAMPVRKFGVPVIEQRSEEKVVQLLYQTLKINVSKHKGIAGDCDLRMVLQFDFSNGLKETFYVNWDRKGLVYNSRNYPLSKAEFELIKQTFDCGNCVARTIL